MTRVLLLLLVAGCKSPPPPSVEDHVEPAFDPGKPPNDRSIFVVAESSDAPVFSRTSDALLLRYGRDVYDANLARRSGEMPYEWTPIIDAGKRAFVVATSRWKDGSHIRLASIDRRIEFQVDGPAKPPAIENPPYFGFSDMAAVATGEIFAVWEDKIRTWPPGTDQPAPVRKGRSALKLSIVEARSASDVWIAGFDFDDKKQRPYIAHFDGRAWTAEDVPGETYVGALAIGSDGSLWYAADRLWWRKSDGTWSSSTVPFPKDGPEEPRPWIERDGLRVVGSDEVWMVVRYHSRHIVARTKAGNGVLDLDDGARLTFAQADKRWFLPARLP